MGQAISHGIGSLIGTIRKSGNYVDGPNLATVHAQRVRRAVCHVGHGHVVHRPGGDRRAHPDVQSQRIGVAVGLFFLVTGLLVMFKVREEPTPG